MPMSFCKAGIGCARRMAEHLGDSVHMVEDVHLELERLSKGLPALEALLKDWPPNPVRKLGLPLKAEVASAIKARHVVGTHSREDLGEIATVLYAVRLREEGEIFDVLTDDGYGKTLVRDRELTLVTTADVVIEMVHAKALTEKDGERVWRQCVSRRRWSAFKDTLARPSPVGS